MADIFNMLDTWNADATVFTGIKLSVTDTASAAGSLLMDLQVGGSSKFSVGKTGAVTTPGSLNAGVDIYWTRDLYALSGTSRITWTGGLSLHQDAANTLAQRNGTGLVPQAFNIYNRWDTVSDYERGFMRWVGNVLEIGAQAAGTGTQRTVRLVNIPVNTLWAESEFANYGLNFNNNGELVAVINGNAKASIGTNLVVSSSGQFSFTSTILSSGARDTGLAREAANIVRVTNGSTGGGAMQLTEMTAPAAPATDNVRIYAEDDGSGKTRLMARFATGAAVQIAIEP